ncbi:rhodanese-like domain-containing protein [Microbulbifer hydrolyticus]|uniref:Rhodanese-like domain-containing protein n=1 Tax=Microbulbifer hydrolyticus TaxID=48074 RepID=A0A6P1TA53_9GAMM|nr:rhodanese-like domain-containing protein [Microbulbifer hydrolyticus]MBB5211970.1 rhodanese-related sulfurtransferase [Microbulbifer hydrolyticus]QHQ39654.1 rhodanese-like domain-containing protein [Microbulbifer hydrolyticus]
MNELLSNPSTAVSKTPVARAPEAAAHFTAKLAFETDCADVWYAMNHQQPDFVLVDVRMETLFATGHLPGAINIPTRKLIPARLAEYSADTLFVVYCAGPHCNGSTKAALKLAQLGRPVKEMIGGVTGWLDEGFELARV